MSERCLYTYKLILYRKLIRENANMDEFTFYYYDFDHLGNVRQVIEADGSPKGKVVQINNYYPFGTPFYDEANTTNASFQPFKYNGKELDMMHGLNTYDYGARQYYAALPVWDRVDLLAEKDRGISPYVYCHDNPVNRIDPDGKTDFRSKTGELIKTIEDGSAAIFTLTGTGSNLHYSFSGFNEKSGGDFTVNLKNAIQEQQLLNLQNPSLQQNADGYNETHCNQATQDVMKTVASAMDNNNDIIISGNANKMASTLAKGDNPMYQSVSYERAKEYAENGGLALVAYSNPKGHGHIATFSVGDNIKGTQNIVNIGPKKYTGFTTINGAIGKNKEKKYYILIENVSQSVIITNKK